MASLRARLGRLVSFPGFVAGTTGLTFVLVLVGVWTAVGGYGLTCEARWPFCDGAVFGLFPANWGSFVEWFHRLIAMIAGFAILGTAIGAWRTGATRRVRMAATIALALTPIQVVLGALTVTRYELLILAAHFGLAIVILGLLVATTVWLVPGAVPVDRGVLAAVAALPLAALLTPGVVVAAHSTTLHVGYYALALFGFVALLGVGLAARERSGARSTPLLAGAAVAGIGLLVGRYTVVAGLGSLFGVVGLSRVAELGALVALTVAAGLAAAAAWLARREGTDVVGSPGR